MKKVMLTLAGMLFVSVLAVNAQVASDTSSTSTNQPSMSSDDQANYTRDMEVIQSSEVPASLRSTLQGSEYSGWEDGKVYRNSSTNEYLIVIGDEDAKTYRFDANGSRIEDSQSGSGTSGSMNSGSTGTTGSGSTGTTGSGSTGTTGSGSTGTTGSGTTGTTGSGSTGTTGSGSTGTTGSGSTGTTGSGSTGTTGSGSTGTTGSGSTGTTGSGSTGTTGSGSTATPAR
jgi:hypothetical protein